MSGPRVIATRAASHEARVGDAGVTWRTVYAGNTAAWDRDVPLRIDLVHPIVATLDAERSPGVTAVISGDAITAFVVHDDSTAWERAIVVTVHAPRARDGAVEILAPPLAGGDAVERVSVTGDDDLRFAPDGSALERHVGYWIAHGLDEPDKRACDEALATRPAIDDAPLYVGRGDGPVVLRGHLTTATDRARGGAIGVTLVSVIVVALLAWGYRRLTGRARIEQAEAFLREEYERG